MKQQGMQNNNLLQVKTFWRQIHMPEATTGSRDQMKKEEVEVLLALLITMGVIGYPPIRYT